MPRNIPANVREELERSQTALIPLVFLTIRHPSLGDAIRVVSNTVDIELDGEVFVGIEFRINMLNENENVPTAKLSVRNADQRINDAILAAVDPPRLEIQVIGSDSFDENVTPHVPIDPDDIPRIVRARHLILTDVEGDDLWISGTIKTYDFTQETWPGLFATEDKFPGLYW